MSEVFGTLLILGMTTVLFATIIVWVSSVPTPAAQSKLDMDASYETIFPDGSGSNVTIRHKGGENIGANDARVYVTITRGGVPATTVLQVEGTYESGPLAGLPYGLVDGRDALWNLGERWQWSNHSTLPTDTISAIVVDHARNRVMWSGDVLGAAGTHPPIFLDKWADRVWSTPSPDTPLTGAAFHIMARIADADDDLVSVSAALTIFFGSPSSCQDPQSMSDDGTYPDSIAGDGVWTLYRTCMDNPSLAWDGSVVLFNATDAMGHTVASRMILRVEPNPAGDGGGFGDPGNGRPPNLRYNGPQGFNIFNGTEWTAREFDAAPTRTFRASEQVIVVVGSPILADSDNQNSVVLYDPFSGIPAAPVVYGPTKTVTLATRPSNDQAFTFYKFVNGYNVFVFAFDLNKPATVGTNFESNPVHPPRYFFGQYPLTMTIVDSTGARFVASDHINVTDEGGDQRNFPLFATYSDRDFTRKANSFQSTQTVYLQVTVQDTAAASFVSMGNVIIRDFRGGTQVFRAPIDGRNANAPICPAFGLCSGNVFSVAASPIVAYRFAVNLTRADQDGWTEGMQWYSLIIASIRDGSTYDQYANLATGIIVVAPSNRMDILLGTADATPPATADEAFGLVYRSVNGVDRFEKMALLDHLTRGPGLTKLVAIEYFDFDGDGDLDIASSADNKVISVHRFDLDSFGNPVFTRYIVITNTVLCKDIGTGDVTADSAPEIVCGFENGHVVYYKNDGSWTPVFVDTTRPGVVNAVEVADFNGDGANDIAVGRGDNRITYYLNLDRLGQFANIAITDDWFAETDATSVGTIVANSFLATYQADDSRESIEEVTVDELEMTNGTVNDGFDASAANWTYADWDNGAQATGSYALPGGNPGGYVDISMGCIVSQRVSGFWSQPFTVSGAGPWTATINLQYRVVQRGNTNSITMYAFVDRTAAVPVPGQEVWQRVESGTTGWLSPAPIAAASKITEPGVYYLKIVARTLYNAGSCTTSTIVGFDNATLSWTSAIGPVSELKHYWRMQRLPNRPSSSYTLFFEGHRSASTDGDAFTVAWAYGGAASPPPDSAFTAVFTVTSSSDAPFSTPIPAGAGVNHLWVRVMDTDRIVGNTTIDRVLVDRLRVRIVTLAGITGSDLVPLDFLAVTTIDAGDQQPDGYADLVVGTAGGHIYKYLGGPGGLTAPATAYYTVAQVPVIGVKLVNATVMSPGLEIAYADATRSAYVITGSGPTGIAISGALPTAGPEVVAALGCGDLDGDGDDDIVLPTTGGAIRYWRNLGDATSWEYTDIENIGAPIYDIDVGDMSNAGYPRC